MGRFYQLTALTYKKLEHSQNDPNKIDKTYIIIVNSDYINNLQITEFLDSRNKTYYRYQVSVIANNSVGIHYLSEEHYNALKTAISSELGLTVIV